MDHDGSKKMARKVKTIRENVRYFSTNIILEIEI